MKTRRNLSASIPNETRKAVYARDGYRCALCDDTHGLQIHHIIHRSCGGNDTPCNLITLCWRCHAEAHGTWVAERHAVRPPHTAEERYAAYRMLQDEYEQQCVEYVSDYYAERGEEWWANKKWPHFRRVTVARGGDCGCMGDARGCRGGLRRGLRRCRAAPPLPLVVLPPDGVSTLRYARGPVPPKRRAAALIGFAPFPLPPPPLAQMASSAGGKSLRARCGVPLRPPVPLLRRLARQRRRAAPPAGSRHPIFLERWRLAPPGPLRRRRPVRRSCCGQPR